MATALWTEPEFSKIFPLAIGFFIVFMTTNATDINVELLITHSFLLVKRVKFKLPTPKALVGSFVEDAQPSSHPDWDKTIYIS
jgi:hypothetical protein